MNLDKELERALIEAANRNGCGVAGNAILSLVKRRLTDSSLQGAQLNQAINDICDLIANSDQPGRMEF